MNVPFLFHLHEMPHDYHRFTPSALKFMAEQSGLQMLENKVLGGLAEAWLGILGAAIYRFPLGGPALSYALYKVHWALLRTGIGRRLAQRSGKTFPYAYFAVLAKPA